MTPPAEARPDGAPAGPTGDAVAAPGLDPARRSALLGVKLAALVEGAWGHGDTGGADGEGVRGRFDLPGGAALSDGKRGWVLLEDDPTRSLGRALAWAERRDVELHVLVEKGAGVLARRAACFERSVQVHAVDGRTLTAASPARHVEPPSPSPAELELAAAFVDAGADVVIEHGLVTAEVNGLEVARVVTDDDGPRIEVGVGRQDREAFAMVHADVAPTDSLARVVATVARHRTAGAEPHPLNRLVAERWMRRWLLENPAAVAATLLEPVPPPQPRRSLGDVEPAFAVGLDPDGPVVVASSVGIDLELVPAAADVRDRHAASARLVLAVPQRDAVGVTSRLAAALREPAEVVVVPDTWRTGDPVVDGPPGGEL